MEPDSFQLDPSHLGPALEACRRALRRFEDEHVPASLRDIASRSGRLPPPLARKLLSVLDESEWLRSEAVAAWPEIDIESSDRRLRISALFLLRPENWTQELEPLKAASAELEAGRAASRLAAELGKAQRRIERLQSEVAKADEMAQAAAESVEERLREHTDRLQTRRAKDRSEVKRLRALVADLEARLEILSNERATLERDLETLKRRRSARPSDQDSATGRALGAWGRRSPLELARHLDDLALAGATTPKDWVPPPRDDVLPPLRLPAGLRPDRAEAITWLLTARQGVIVAIDGWNAAHLLVSPATSEARQRVVEAGRRIRLASQGRRKVVVFFDSREGSEHFNNPEVEVRFVASADEELLELARRSTIPTVIVSSDRMVREGAESAGAVGLWSEALIDWLQTGGRRTFGR